MDYCRNVKDWSKKFDDKLKLSLSDLFWLEEIIEDIWNEGFKNGKGGRSEDDYEQGYKDGYRNGIEDS